ncbi:glycosyltransferase family 39 protein [Pseudodesulfovibrio sp.]|uniref:ArnT family glycosyltransferase n=1 Tax=Pseudodesulfovibrio sp. TaxID=2035812 RepID=UPI002628823B|nr:glycosyltransferase family 39 protein [Pseudodesulfovibrio sp.]MDD3312465.1 glycosyltransferase family 39 protein [Pseudodesulfovibrio sp.]
MKDFANRLWRALESHPWITMVLGVLAQTWFTLNNRALWFSDEVRYADAYRNLAENGHWMVLALNGQAYPDKPPVYFWFLWLIDKLTPADPPAVFFLGAALSGLMLVASAFVLARTLKFDRTVSLAAALLLLANFFLAGLFHYSRMDLMFAALIVLSHACFFKAAQDDAKGRWPLWGFLLAGVATLVKGPLGFLFPLVTLAAYLLWKGEGRKLFTRAMGLGLLAMLGLLALWVAGVILAVGPDVLIHTVLGHQILERATHTFHHREPLQYYFIALPLAWLPWTLFLLAAPVARTLSPARLGDLWGGRREAGPRAFLWLMFLTIFALLSSLSGKVLVYILPMFPPLAILTADALFRSAPERTARFWKAVAGLWLILGLGLLAGGDFLPFPVPVRGLGLSACLLVLGGAAIHAASRRGNRAALLASVLALIVWLYPVGLLVAPSLDNAMSPRRQALIIGKYADQGYAPMAFKIYSGIFTWYAGHDLAETGDPAELKAWLDETDKAVLSIRRRHFDEWKDRPAGLTVIDEQDIAGMDYLIVLKQ